jgi:hypothetical protein
MDVSVGVELGGSLLKAGCIDMEVDLGREEVDVSHGVGQNGKQGIDILLRLAP